MGSRVRKSRRSFLLDEELRSSVPRKTADESIVEAAGNISLKNIPLKERRREAEKPLFLTRYE